MGTHRLLARAAPQDPAIESLRSVHLSLVLRARSIQAQVIVVTAPSYGAGKSFVASNLAALMAETGKSVLLIEADMRKPAVYRYVNLDPNASGLSDVLCGERSLDEVIYPHATANLDMLMHGTMSENPGSLLLMPELAATMRTLRERYDHIVIHTPPLRAVGDALAFAPVADCALLVVRSEQSLLDEANDAMRRLERAGLRLEGVIFNGVQPSRQRAVAEV
jgi:tyrosine-protein kinase Etk/Wzc